MMAVVIVIIAVFNGCKSNVERERERPTGSLISPLLSPALPSFERAQTDPALSFLLAARSTDYSGLLIRSTYMPPSHQITGESFVSALRCHTSA